MLKRGRLSKSEMTFIKENADRLTDKEIATNLNREPACITKFRKKTLGIGQDVTERAAMYVQNRKDLQERSEWDQLKKELMSHELSIFKDAYAKYMEQFKDDILPTEETQLFLLIKFEILMSRNLIQRRETEEDIIRQKKHVNKLESDDKMNADAILGFETVLAGYQGSLGALVTEYDKLCDKHQKLMREIKGTRDQRIKDIESSKKSIIGLIKALDNREVRDAEGKRIALMHKAVEKEYDKLAEYHEYEDGEVDRPLLNADTIGRDSSV